MDENTNLQGKTSVYSDHETDTESDFTNAGTKRADQSKTRVFPHQSSQYWTTKLLIQGSKMMKSISFPNWMLLKQNYNYLSIQTSVLLILKADFQNHVTQSSCSVAPISSIGKNYHLLVLSKFGGNPKSTSFSDKKQLFSASASVYV